jgi:hypothetical protein
MLPQNNKSQLEIYLEQIEGDGRVDSQLSKNIDATVDRHVNNSLHSSRQLINKVVSFIFSGALKDFSWVFKNFRQVSCVQTSTTGYSGSDVARIFIILYFILCTSKNCFLSNVWPNSHEVHLVSFIWNLTETILVLLCVGPLIFGAILAVILNQITIRCKLTHDCCFCLLGVIKRIQLVSLGRSLSHPLPPLCALESVMAAQYGYDHSFVCKDTRNAMKYLLLELMNAVSLVLSVAVGTCNDCSADSATRLVTQRLKRYASHVQVAIDSGSEDIATSAYLQHMMHLSLVEAPQVCTECVDLLVETRVSSLISWLSSDICSDVPRNTSLCYHISVACSLLSLILECPLVVSKILCAVDRCRHQLKVAANGLCIQGAVPNSPVNRCDNSVPTEGYRFSSTYLAARAHIGRLRAKYEEVSHRLWLCDQALSSVAAAQCLLPDEQISVMLGTVDNSFSTDTFSSLCNALASLHAATVSEIARDSHILSSPQSDNAHAMSLSDRLDHFCASLPTLSDWHALDGQLKALVVGSSTGVLTADRSDFNNVEDAHRLDGEQLAAVSVGDFRSSLLMRNDEDSASCAHLELVAGDEMSLEQQRRDKKLSSADNIVEVYAAIVPKQTVSASVRRGSVSEQSAQQKHQQADREREAMQAKSLLMELSLALSRKDGSGVTERVRTIVTRTGTAAVEEGEGGEVDIQQTEIVLNQLSPGTANSECEKLSANHQPLIEIDPTTPPTVININSNAFAMTELRNILASSNRPGGGAEMCYSCSDDDE